MGYADSLLASGERIVRIAHQHWFILVWRARWAILALIVAALIGGFRVINSGDGVLWTILGWLLVAMLAFGVVSVAWGALTYRAEEFVITSRRIIHAEGVINKRATDSSLEKINDAVLTESIFGRIFGFGDLDVLTASESGIERLKMLRDAKDFKKAMLEAKHELEIELTRPTMPAVRAPEAAPAPAATAAPAAAPVADDAPTTAIDTPEEVTAALERLAGLRDSGAITPEDYDAKKAELLGRL